MYGMMTMFEKEKGRWFVFFVLTTWYIILFQQQQQHVMVVSAWNPSRISSSIRRMNGGERRLVPSSLNERNEEGEEKRSIYFVTCLPGMQSILREELMQQPGVFLPTTSSSSSNKGVELEATLSGILRVLIWVRTCHTIMELVCTTDYGIHTRQDLYYFLQDSIHWKQLLLLSSNNNNNNHQLGTIMVQAIINNPTKQQQQQQYNNRQEEEDDLNHSHFTALTVKNAIVDMVRNDIGQRPNVDLDNPDVPLCIVLHRNTGGATLYRTIHHPTSLHKRGYRITYNNNNSIIHKAAMKETMAAGLLYMAGWHRLIQDTQTNTSKTASLIDPMTGSATLCIEAALMAANIAPALIRIKTAPHNNNNNNNIHQYPPILKWSHSYNNNNNNNNNNEQTVLKLWHSLLLEAKNAMDVSFLKQQCIINANEMNPAAFQLAKQSIHTAGMSSYISLNQGNCIDWNITIQHTDRTIIVANPPWGIRLNHNYNTNHNNNNDAANTNDNAGDDESSWLDLSTFLKNKCQGTEAWILNGNDKTTTRLLRMKRTHYKQETYHCVGYNIIYLIMTMTNNHYHNNNNKNKKKRIILRNKKKQLSVLVRHGTVQSMRPITKIVVVYSAINKYLYIIICTWF